MGKIVLLYLLFFLIISCKKQEVRNFDNLNSSEYFSISSELKNLKNIEKNKINDSLYKITGTFNNYEITGFVDHENIRVGWWIATNKQSKEINAKLEYKFVDNKEFVNQYILFKNGKIDSTNSKFYWFDRNKNLIKYNFYIPNSSKSLEPEGKLNYHIYSNGTELKHLQCKCLQIENIFSCEFPYPKDIESKKIIIRGNFWELFQMKNGNVGENEIYVLDTLK
ncbi:hypothetical protein LF887_04280 [Chryseobacterium sp. MEBOG06]|uniref:hypothetical protein n=1 Tax=Chryseobacterium sp. MEBOG06 TaxID=2879938 RepID=UPI001F40B78B|nr:hypothetical protein [Chryseobacterium sp. MEBOG06]UKB84843.1 hypothetical protein LF887_04185 [Chryseobacterium sp. MEBOG06]UKB84859.1 hypothetical protein LF887_04280 [Chryseobacterium sp. MEBOG06]